MKRLIKNTGEFCPAYLAEYGVKDAKKKDKDYLHVKSKNRGY